MMTLAPPDAAGPVDPRPAIFPDTAGGSAPGGPAGATSVSARVRLGPAAAGRCRRRVHLDADPGAPRGSRAVVDDGLRLRLVDGARHRDAVLAAVRSTLQVSDGQGWAPAEGRRPLVVVEPVLHSDTRFGVPDLLLWAGDGYRPVIVRSHRTTDPGSGAITSDVRRPLDTQVDNTRRARSHPADALALAHHYRLLTDLGIASSLAVGGVIGRGVTPGTGSGEPPTGEHSRGGDDGRTVVWHQLDVAGSSVLSDYDIRFSDRLAVASAAASGGTPLALPSRIGECRRCSWWPVCSAELTAMRDVSLIAAGSDVDVLHAAGIRTADDLANAARETLGALPLTGLDPGTARVRARAWLAGVPLVRRIERPTVRRADLELDVDMESYLEDGAYLWGTYLSGPAVAPLGLDPGYRAFVSWRPLPDPDEGRAFAELWAYLTSLRSLAAARGLTFAAYCYSRSAEERWMRSSPVRYSRVPGMPTPAAVAEFCASADWVDIYQELRNQFVVPGSMKLKVLAPLAGFTWRDPEPGGENSMAWYREAVGVAPGAGHPGTEPVDPVQAERILRYNEDDVLATLALRNWITERSGTVPSVDELDAD